MFDDTSPEIQRLCDFSWILRQFLIFVLRLCFSINAIRHFNQLRVSVKSKVKKAKVCLVIKLSF